MNPYLSLAEAFARGTYKAEYPPDDVTVSYSSRVYPEIDVQELLKHAAIEDIQGQDGSFDFRDPRVVQHTFGWTISLDYVNVESYEIIHRIELTRATRQELFEALPEIAKQITNKRQRRVFRKWLKEGTARGTILKGK